MKREKRISGTNEWASRNFNIMRGCQHGCLYCYARSMCLRHKKTSPDKWETPFLIPEAVTKRFGRGKGTIMFPTTHDIHPDQINEVITVLKSMLSAGNKVLIVSKPHEVCIRSICDQFSEYKKQILFRFTLGSADDEILSFWEPHAPGYDERLQCLKIAHNSGYATSVSSEPMLDGHIRAVIKDALPHVTDALWIGMPNLLTQRLKMNKFGSPEVIQKAEELLRDLSTDYIKGLYAEYKSCLKIKYKESVKEILGLPLVKERGLDI